MYKLHGPKNVLLVVNVLYKL